MACLPSGDIDNKSPCWRAKYQGKAKVFRGSSSRTNFERLGTSSEFPGQVVSQTWLLKQFGLAVDGICTSARSMLKKRSKFK